MQVFNLFEILIATYSEGGDKFGAMNMKAVYAHLKEIHGGREVCSSTASNQTVEITWVDNIDNQHILQVVTGPLVGMDDKPRYLSKVTEPVDIYVATRANIDYWAGEVENECEEGSHEYIVYAGEIKLCVDKYTGKEK